MGSRDLTTEEAMAYAVDPRNDQGPFVVMAQNYDSDCPNYNEHDPVTGECKCWDGITSEDVDSSPEVADFAEWGPFQLWFEGEDPGPARGFTPEEAIDAIASRLEAFEGRVGNDGMTGEMSRAVDTIHSFITRIRDHGSEDLEWGEAGECWERLRNDPDIHEALDLGDQYGDAVFPKNNETWESVQQRAIAADLGNHYGDPHCIWCLQGQ